MRFPNPKVGRKLLINFNGEMQIHEIVMFNSRVIAVKGYTFKRSTGKLVGEKGILNPNIIAVRIVTDEDAAKIIKEHLNKKKFQIQLSNIVDYTIIITDKIKGGEYSEEEVKEIVRIFKKISQIGSK